MTTATVIVMLLAALLPLATEAITKDGISPKVKVWILLLLSSATGVVGSLVGHAPTSLAGWGHVGLNVVMAFVAAVAADHGLWNPWQVKPAVATATGRFGFGPKAPPAPTTPT